MLNIFRNVFSFKFIVPMTLLGLLGGDACQGGIVYKDTFASGIGPEYQPIGTASLSSSPGLLNVQTPSIGDGLTINLGSVGVTTADCIILGGLSLFSSTGTVGNSFTIQVTGMGSVNGTPESFVFQDVFTQQANGTLDAAPTVTIGGVTKVGGVVTNLPNNQPGESYRIDILKGAGANGSDVIEEEAVALNGRYTVISKTDPATIFFNNFDTLSITDTAGDSSGFSMTSVTGADIHLVPEPSSLTLGSIALLTLLGYLRFHRASGAN